MEGSLHFKKLRFAYDSAFEQLRTDVRALKLAQHQPQVGSVDDLRQKVQDAEVVYRQSRDELAQFILGRQDSEFPETAQV